MKKLDKRTLWQLAKIVIIGLAFVFSLWAICQMAVFTEEIMQTIKLK